MDDFVKNAIGKPIVNFTPIHDNSMEGEFVFLCYPMGEFDNKLNSLREVSKKHKTYNVSIRFMIGSGSSPDRIDIYTFLRGKNNLDASLDWLKDVNFIFGGKMFTWIKDPQSGFSYSVYLDKDCNISEIRLSDN